MFEEHLTDMTKKFRCLALPDVFLDHYVFVDEMGDFIGKLNSASKSGDRLRFQQSLKLGGNAFNFAYHLARIGCASTLVTKTSETVFQEILGAVHGLDFCTDYVAVGYEPSLTIAIEAKADGVPINCNLNHPGYLAHFSKKDVPDRVFNKRFDLVGVFNWANNEQGSELAREVFRSFDCVKLFDLATPQLREDKIYELEEILRYADIVSGNEAEIVYLSQALGCTENDNPADCATQLSKKGVTIALHSKTYSLEVSNSTVTVEKIEPVVAKKETGAGDAWTAAYSYAYLAGFRSKERLLFANKYASEYVKSC
jgi:sugar/nucleoside kinase (ribokinase family)